MSFEQGFAGEILLWDVNVVGPPTQLTGQSYFTTSVSFDSQGTHLASLGGGGLRLHRLKDGAWLTLDSFTDADGAVRGVAYYENGLFEGDPGAFEKLTFQTGRVGRGSELVSGTELAEVFHHPGLLAGFLRGAPIPTPAQEQPDE